MASGGPKKSKIFGLIQKQMLLKNLNPIVN